MVHLVLRGSVGFGHSGEIHTAKILDLTSNLRLVVEIIDGREKIDVCLEAVQEMLASTLEKVRVLQYGQTRPRWGNDRGDGCGSLREWREGMSGPFLASLVARWFSCRGADKGEGSPCGVTNWRFSVAAR